MKTATTLGLSSLIVLTLGAFTIKDLPVHPSVADGSYFLAEMHGDDVHASPKGTATYGLVESRDGVPQVFALSLGADGASGSVLFTRTSGARLTPGTYTVGGRDDGTDEFRALVVTGTATHPTGVFRGQSGYLVVTAANDSVIRGRFTLGATGFVASAPEDETRRIEAVGMFTAMPRVAR